MGRLVILLERYYRDKLGIRLHPLKSNTPPPYFHIHVSLSLAATLLPFSYLNPSLSPWSSTKNTSAMSFFSSHHHRLWRKDFGKRGTRLAKQGIWGKIPIFLTKLSNLAMGFVLEQAYWVYVRDSYLEWKVWFSLESFCSCVHPIMFLS